VSDVVDDTRVKLDDGDPDDPGSDYINANYITVSYLKQSLLLDVLSSVLSSRFIIISACAKMLITESLFNVTLVIYMASKSLRLSV